MGLITSSPPAGPQLEQAGVAAAGPALLIEGLAKSYATGFKALEDINLRISPGEIFALLGPNGAGKTTLISIVCGIVNASAGRVLVGGHDITRDYRAARSLIGLVPQELSTDAFETVLATVRFSRGLFGKPPNPAHIEAVLRDLSLWDKRNDRILTLSGGMKRRVMIAKALSHEPRMLFLDEPTAGVDVELRRDMWQMVRLLRDKGVTIILTTHYIEEAEEMADRIGVIDRGRIILVEDKDVLMRRLGKTQLWLRLDGLGGDIPAALSPWNLQRSEDGQQLIYTYSTQDEETPPRDGGVPGLLRAIERSGLALLSLETRKTSLEDIFVSLVHRP